MIEPLLLHSRQRVMGIEEAIERVGCGLFQARLMLVCGWMQLADATEMLVLSFLIEELKCEWPYLDDGTAWHGLNIWSIVPVVVYLGMVIGAVVTGVVSDRCGRRTGIAATIALVGIAGCASAFSPNLWVLCALRFAVGVGLGGSPASLALLAEHLPRRRRGTHLVLFFLFFTIGGVLSALLAWATLPAVIAFSSTLSVGGWRLLLAAASLPSLLLLIFALPCGLVPESPRYFLVTGCPQKALALLEAAARTNRRSLLEYAAVTGSTAHRVRIKLVVREEEREVGDEVRDASPRSSPRAGLRGAGQTLAGRTGDGVSDGAAASPSPLPRRSCCAPLAELLTAGRRVAVLVAALATLYLLTSVLYIGVVFINRSYVADAGVGGHAPMCDVGGRVNRSHAEFIAVATERATELPGLLALAVLLDCCGLSGLCQRALRRWRAKARRWRRRRSRARSSLAELDDAGDDDDISDGRDLASDGCGGNAVGVVAACCCNGCRGVGRRGAVVVLYTVAAVSLALLAVPWTSLSASFPPLAGAAIGIALTSLARATSLGINHGAGGALTIYAAEAFPTSVRVTGLGVTTAFARLGGLLSPLIGAFFAYSHAGCLGTCVTLAVIAVLVARFALPRPPPPSVDRVGSNVSMRTELAPLAQRVAPLTDTIDEARTLWLAPQEQQQGVGEGGEAAAVNGGAAVNGEEAAGEQEPRSLLQHQMGEDSRVRLRTDTDITGTRSQDVVSW